MLIFTVILNLTTTISSVETVLHWVSELMKTCVSGFAMYFIYSEYMGNLLNPECIEIK